MFDKRKFYAIIKSLSMKPINIIIPIFISLLVSAITLPAFSQDEKTIDEVFPDYKVEKETINAAPETPKKKLWTDEEDPERVFVLKKTDPDRIGAEAAYEDFAGLRFGKYFSVGQRVEIYQEAKPVDALILNMKKSSYFPRRRNIDTPVEYRQFVVPTFTRAYGTQFTLDNPEDPSGQVAQWRYTLDYRDIYKQWYPVYPEIDVERWIQHEIMMIHGMKIPGIEWNYTLNLGFRFSNIAAEESWGEPGTPGFYHIFNAASAQRYTYIANLALAPNERFEWFGQFEYHRERHPRITTALPSISNVWEANYDHFLYRTEFRFKTQDQKTAFTPWFSYSMDKYHHFRDVFEKYEIGAKLGRDFTKKFRASTQIEYIISKRAETDNIAPLYTGVPLPEKHMASYIGSENRAEYNIWNDFWLQGGIDLAFGLNESAYDNWGTFLGLQYYRPGVLRASVGWNMNHYYNIDDFLNTVGFRIYIFM